MTKPRSSLIVGLAVISAVLVFSPVGSYAVTIYNEWAGQKAQSYLIFTDGSDYYAQNGETGAILSSGTNARTVIQAALDALPNEGGKIFIKAGDYEITTTLQIGGIDNLTIEGEGSGSTRLYATGAAGNIIRQSGTAIDRFTLKHIEVDGNDVADVPIYFNGPQNVVFDDVYAHNSNPTTGSFVVFFTSGTGTQNNILLQNSRFGYSGQGFDIVAGGHGNFTAINNLFENTPSRTGEGIAWAQCNNIAIINNVFTSNTGAGFAGNGFHTESGCQDVRVIGNYLKLAGNNIDGIDHDVADPPNVTKRVVIANNIIDGTPAFGLGNIANGINVNGAMEVVISGNIITNTTRYGVRLMDVQDVVVDGNVCLDCSTANAGITMGDGTSRQTGFLHILNYTNPFNGLDLTSKSNIVVTDNMIRTEVNSFTSGMLLDNEYSNIFVFNNDMSDTNALKIYDIATGTIIRDNSGFITENEGTGTINNAATSATITHGLSYTPSAAECTVTWTENPTNDPGNWWISGISSTQFTVNVRADPGASNLDFSWACRRI